MKKIYLLILILLITIPLFSQKKEKTQTKIKSLFDIDSKPLLFIPKGYNPYNYRPFDPSQYSFIEEPGKAEQIGGMYFDETSQKYLILSKNFLDLNTNLFVLNSLNIKNVDDLKKHEIGVVQGDFAYQFLQKNFPEVKLKVYRTYEELIYKAIHGEVTVFAQNFPTAMLFLSKYGALDYFKQFQLFFPTPKRTEKEAEIQKLFEKTKKEKKKKKNQESEDTDYDTDTEKKTQKQPQQEMKEAKPQVMIVEEKFPLPLLLLITVFPAVLALFMFYWFAIRKKKNHYGKSSQILKEKDWKKILKIGENETVEFKSSLRWDFKEEQINPVLEFVVIKTISAFLNSQGGWLFIGVGDNGEILGLDKDYQVLNKKNKDGFILKITELINDYLGKDLHQYIKINVQTEENKEIAIIQVFMSKKPVFVKSKNKEEFFIRAGASSQSMGLKEAHEYISTHWG